MNILFYFYELNTPMYYWWRVHVIDELEHHDIHFTMFNPAEYSSPEEANHIFVDFVRQSGMKYDLFFSCVESKWLFADTVNEIKHILSVPAILFTADNLELPYKHKDNCKAFDLVWVTSKETEYLFKKWGCKTVFQTYAANPYLYKPSCNISDSETIYSIGFIGSPYGSRANKLNKLISNCIPTSVYSNSLLNKGYNQSLDGQKELDIIDFTTKLIRYLRFPIGRKVLYSTILNKLNSHSSIDVDNCFLGKYASVSQSEMCDLYTRFALSINISELRDTYILKNPIPKIHLRTFEIPMCGGLQLTSYNDEIASYFEEDKEIVLYRTDDEMIDKCRFYLDKQHEAEIKKMKDAAYNRAKRDHTWYNRFCKVFEAL